MSGRPYDSENALFGDPPPLSISAEMEADVQCALSNTSPVLITAPAELAAAIARRIHRSSTNRRGPFLTIDCGRTQLPEQLMLAFEAASGGTVFLRDVDRLAPVLQAQLYSQIMPLRVRVIAGTAVSLLRAAAQGTFDEGLFYRLNQIHLVAPLAAESGGAA